MPRLDPEMREGTILEWFKREGDQVQKGEAIASVEGEKVVFEVEAPESGVLTKIVVREGQTIPVAELIAILAEPNETLEDMDILLPTSLRKKGDLIRASPLARRIAKEHGVDLAKVEGSGLGGRIEKKDVIALIEEAAKSNEVAPTLEFTDTIPLTGMRRTIADRMTSSYRTIPHVAITMEVDMSEALRLRETIEKMKGVKIPFTAFLTKVVAHALKNHPQLNAVVEEEQIKIHKKINIGIAVALEDGLIVPVIYEADVKSVLEIASITSDLIKRAKERSLTMEELREGTFTITNLGGYGVDVFTPIINPPQTAILGIGRIVEKPRVVNGSIKAIPVITLTLVFDHRAVDGAKAAQFLQDIKGKLEDPYKLFTKL